MGHYPEKILQLQALAWLEAHRGYAGCFSDEESRGARMDAAGRLGDRLVLIETKVRAADLLTVGPDDADQVECKVSATLTALYRGLETPLTRAAAEIWDRRRRPLIALLAGDWSPGLSHMNNMTGTMCSPSRRTGIESEIPIPLRSLAGGRFAQRPPNAIPLDWSPSALDGLRTTCERRAREWGFDWEFWLWTGTHVETIAAGGAPILDQAGSPPNWAEIPIPLLRATGGRAVARKIEELRIMAAERGVGALFERFLTAAATSGYGLKPGRICLSATRKRFAGRDTAVVVSAYLDHSSPGRLAVGFVKEWFDVEPTDLPGTPSPGHFYYLNEDRFFIAHDEIDRLFALPLRTIE